MEYQSIVLVLHLVITLLLIGAVLIQRSEGGALGIGGGGNVMSGRGAATAIQKATWGLAAAFVLTSIFLALVGVERQGVDTEVVAPPSTTSTPVEVETPEPAAPADDLSLPAPTDEGLSLPASTDDGFSGSAGDGADTDAPAAEDGAATDDAPAEGDSQ